LELIFMAVILVPSWAYCDYLEGVKASLMPGAKVGRGQLEEYSLV